MSNPALPKDLTGKPFERLVAAVQKKLDGDAIVEWDSRMKGKSGVQRQIDVAIHGRRGSAKLFIAVEAKDYASKIDIEIVESFIAKLADIGANKGILVTSTGYESGALLRAREAGVDTCVLRPAKDEDWRGRVQYIETSVWYQSATCENAILVLMDGEQVAIPWNGNLSVVYDDGVETTVSGMVWNILEGHPDLAGKFNEIIIESPRHYLRDDPNRRQIKKFFGTFRIDDELGIQNLTKAPHDCIFIQHLPDGVVENEKSFFIFKELEKLADDFKKA